MPRGPRLDTPGVMVGGSNGGGSEIRLWLPELLPDDDY